MAGRKSTGGGTAIADPPQKKTRSGTTANQGAGTRARAQPAMTGGAATTRARKVSGSASSGNGSGASARTTTTTRAAKKPAAGRGR
jgi:hypothetical protein